MLSRHLGRLSAPVLRHGAAAFAPIAPTKITTSLSMPLRAVLTQHTAGVCSSAPLQYTLRDLHAFVYGTSKKTAHELGEDYGVDTYDESHNHPVLWLISIASTGVMAYMLWNNHLPEDKERIHRDFYAWLRSFGIPIAHAEAAQAAVKQATAAVSAGERPAQTPLTADPAKLRPMSMNPAAAAAAVAAVTGGAAIAEDDPPLAGYLWRFLAFCLDTLVVNGTMVLLHEAIARLRPNGQMPFDSFGGMLGTNALGALIFDFFCLLQCDGKTPGKWALSLRTVKKDFTQMDAATAIKTAATRLVLSPIPVVDFVTAFSSKCRENGQMLHNWAGDTIVIDESAQIEYDD